MEMQNTKNSEDTFVGTRKLKGFALPVMLIFSLH